MNTIEVKVTTKHFRNAIGYSSSQNCPLALAIKDTLKSKKNLMVGVIVGDVRIKTDEGTFNYQVTEEWSCAQTIYGGKWKGAHIDYMIRAAKADKKLRIPTLTLTLTRYPF